MNETLQTIAHRYSCRAYDGRPPDRQMLEAIALAAVQAPSAMNRQPWQVIVLADKSLVEELDGEGMRLVSESEDRSFYERLMKRGGTMFYNAPSMFLVLQQADTDMDVGIVAQNITLAAASLGLGSVICGMATIPFAGPRGDALKQRAGISEGWEIGVGVLVGYAQGTGSPHPPDLSKVRFIG